MEKLDNRVLHPVMYLSKKSSISFLTARAFAVILPTSLSARYLKSRTELKTIYLSFVWSLTEPHSSKPVQDTS